MYKLIIVVFLATLNLKAFGQCVESNGRVYKPIGQQRCYGTSHVTGTIPPYAAIYGGSWFDPTTGQQYIIIPQSQQFWALDDPMNHRAANQTWSEWMRNPTPPSAPILVPTPPVNPLTSDPTWD